MKQQNTLGFCNKEPQLNLLKLLKDCKENTQFYSKECGRVVFSHIEGNSILVYTENGDARSYDSKGYDVNADPTAEPMFFPSKDVQDWSFYKVKYIKVNNQAEAVKAIEYFEQEGYIKNMYITYLAAGGVVYIDAITHEINTHSVNDRPYCYDYILSTGTELKLEKKQPKFKFGDVVISGNAIYIVDDDYHDDSEHYITISCANAGAYHIATPDVIDGWNEMRLHPNHMHYSTGKRKIIHWFLPFDRVIVKDFKDGADCTRSPYPCWKAQIFSHYNKHDEEFPYCCLNDSWAEIVPYNERTAKLIGTTDEYEEK